jgi:hypothetical protein
MRTSAILPRLLVPVLILSCSSDDLIGPTPTTSRALLPAAVANGAIAFASARDGNFEIYVMNADGSGRPT